MKHVLLLIDRSLIRRQNRFKLLFTLLLTIGISSAVHAQVTVTGKVTDDTGAGLPGVNVVLKGTTSGTTTDANGNYSMSLSGVNEQSTLVFSFIGFDSQEQQLNGRTSIDVNLVANIQALNEVVVVGYGSQKKSDVTGAMVRLNEETLRDVPVANIQQAMQGRAAGIDIQSTSSRPGAGAIIRIRGSRSLGNPNDPTNPNPPNNDPLIVVDGIPFNGNINDLNPNDIISLDVLKDASATAIYGSRGSNGVIIVTTKRGKKGAPQLSYNGYAGTGAAIGKYKIYGGAAFDQFRTAAGIYSPTPTEVANLAAGKSVDWQDLMYKKSYITSHNISASGGTEETQYSISAGYFKQTTVLPGQDMTRYSLGAAIDQKIGERIKIGLNTLNSLNITNGENLNPMFQILTLSPLYDAYNADGTINATPAIGSVDPTNRSPLLLYNTNSWAQQRRKLRTFNSLYGEIKIVEGLKYRLNIGLDYFTDLYGQYYSSETPFANGGASQGQVQSGQSSSYTLENLITYDKTFAEKHKLSFTGLYSVQEVEFFNNQTSAQDLPADYTLFYNLGLANTIVSTSGNYSKSGLLSYMGRINYAFNDKYLLTLTARTDGSSRLAAGHQWYTYPAVAGAWNISKEPFMANIQPTVSNLKLRVGVGQTANQAIQPYQSQGGLGKVPYNFGSSSGTYGYVVNSLPNNNLHWENTLSTNVGLDFGLFSNRVTGSLEFYQQKTDGILQSRTLPTTAGVSSVTQNIGSSENKGVEVTLSGTVIESKDPSGFTWSMDVNWFANRNKITSLGSGVLIDANNGWYVGYPIDAIYDYKKIGIWQSSEASEATAMGSYLPGNIKVADIAGPPVNGVPSNVPDGKIDANDRTVLGSLQAKWQGGLTSRFTYKGLSLDVVLFGRVGGMLVSTLYQSNVSNPFNTLEGRRNGPVVDYWTDSNPTNAYPKPGQSNNPIFGSTLGYFDATYMKIRTINLGYTLPASWLGKTGISSLKVYVQAQNPFKAFFSDYVKAGGLDPESTGNGLTTTPGWGYRPAVQPNTPPVRQFIIGVNLKY